MKKEVYLVFWKDFLVGILEIKNGRHRYKIFKEAIKKAEAEGMANQFIGHPQSYYGEKIVFFENRINSNWKNEKSISFITDNVRLELIEEDKKT